MPVSALSRFRGIIDWFTRPYWFLLGWVAGCPNTLNKHSSTGDTNFEAGFRYGWPLLLQAVHKVYAERFDCDATAHGTLVSHVSPEQGECTIALYLDEVRAELVKNVHDTA